MEVSRPLKRGDLALARPMGVWVLGWLLPLLALFQGMVVLAVSPPGPVGTLRLAVEADPHSLDPGQVFSNEEAMLCFLLFNNLLDPKPEGGFVPVLAESLPVTSPDGLIHTFVLRRGIRFSDGEELVADDVVYTFERYFDPQVITVNGAYFRAIKGSKEFHAARVQEAATRDPSRSNRERWIQPLTVSGLRALDRYTVQIQLETPDLAFLHMLTTGSAGIVRRTDPKRPTESLGNIPIGAGPFVLKNWVRGARIQMERNPYYSLKKTPQPDRIDVLANLDRTTQFMMFERGELDFQHYIQDPDFVRLRRQPQLSSALRVVAGSSPTFVFMNCEMPPFTNRLVRLALNYAIDKEQLVRVLANRCVVARGPLPLAVHGFNQGVTAYPHDPAKARALLAQAGLTNGFESTLWTNRDDPRWIKIALFVQQSLKEYGIRLEIREVGYPTLVELCGKRRKVPMGVFDWVSAADDPKELLDSLLNGDNILDENCVNVAFYSNPRAQQLFRDAVAEANSNRRLDIYRQIESIVVEDVPWIFLVQFNTEVLVQPWVKGFNPRGFWPPARFDSTWIER